MPAPAPVNPEQSLSEHDRAVDARIKEISEKNNRLREQKQNDLTDEQHAAATDRLNRNVNLLISERNRQTRQILAQRMENDGK